MTVFNGTFPGTLTLQNDSPQEIVVANAFSFPSAATEGQRTIIGARVYVPAAVVGSLPAAWYAMLWTSNNLSVAPARAQTGSVVAGWNSVTFVSPYVVEAGGTAFVGYTFGGTYGTPGGTYLSWSAPAATAYTGPTGVNIPGTGRSRYRYGAGATEDGGNSLWGVDVVLSGGGTTPPADPDIVLATPVVTVAATANPTTSTAADGTIQITWPAVSGAASYEAGIRAGSGHTSGFTVTTGATSPHTFTGLAGGTYTVAVRALPGA